jgi:hypothetical protein
MDLELHLLAARQFDLEQDDTDGCRHRQDDTCGDPNDLQILEHNPTD